MEAKQAIEVMGGFIYFDAAKMVLDKLYAVRLKGVPYVLCKVRDHEVYFYGLAQESRI